MIAPLGPPTILPLGDAGLLVRFGATLSDEANRATIAFARQLRRAFPAGVVEIDPNLVSVLLKYDPERMSFERLAGEVRLLLSGSHASAIDGGQTYRVAVSFNGADLEGVCRGLAMTEAEFVAAHNARPLRVLTTGFAPGFVYCGFHSEAMRLPRRADVRPPVPAGTVLFAAGQTAITSTPVPTGWHVIGTTAFRNFDAAADPPTRLREGDHIAFEVAP